MFFSDIPFFGAAVLAAFGIVLTAFGIKSIQQTRYFRVSGTRHDAVVTSVAVLNNKEGRKSYWPTFQFTDADGWTVKKPTDVADPSYDFEIGSTHAVLDLTHATAVVLADRRTDDYSGYALSAGGVICLCIGLIGMVA